MNFDNPKVYGDTSITDGLVFPHSRIHLEAKSASGGQKVDRFVTAGEVAEMGAASMER